MQDDNFSYKIPESLDQSWMDTEINLSTKKVAIKPLPAKVVFGFLGGILGTYWFVNRSFMQPSPFWLKCLIGLICLSILSLLLMPDATGSSRYTLVPALMDYIQGSNRKVIVRSNKPANNFMHISGINRIWPENGIIKFVDGSFGLAYRITGNASLLLFTEDKKAVLNRVDTFYRNIKTDYQLIYITAKEPQYVRDQVHAIDERRHNLQYTDPDLKALLHMDRRILKDVIGKTFRSTHQYLIIKAPNPEALMVGKQMMVQECRSQLMFRNADALFNKDLERMLGSIYKGKESI